MGQALDVTEDGLAIQGSRFRAVLFNDANLAAVRTALVAMGPDADITGIVYDPPINGDALITFVLADRNRLEEFATQRWRKMERQQSHRRDPGALRPIHDPINADSICSQNS